MPGREHAFGVLPPIFIHGSRIGTDCGEIFRTKFRAGSQFSILLRAELWPSRLSRWKTGMDYLTSDAGSVEVKSLVDASRMATLGHQSVKQKRVDYDRTEVPGLNTTTPRAYMYVPLLGEPEGHGGTQSCQFHANCISEFNGITMQLASSLATQANERGFSGCHHWYNAGRVSAFHENAIP